MAATMVWVPVIAETVVYSVDLIIVLMCLKHNFHNTCKERRLFVSVISRAIEKVILLVLVSELTSAFGISKSKCRAFPTRRYS